MSERAVEGLRRDLDTEYSYLDALTVAVATSGVRAFTSDRTRWADTLRTLRDEYPDILHGIWFSERGYSEQLDGFFRVMARAGALSPPSPGYNRFDMSLASAAAIADAASPLMMRDHGDAVRAIAIRLRELRYE